MKRYEIAFFAQIYLCINLKWVTTTFLKDMNKSLLEHPLMLQIDNPDGLGHFSDRDLLRKFNVEDMQSRLIQQRGKRLICPADQNDIREKHFDGFTAFDANGLKAFPLCRYPKKCLI